MNAIIYARFSPRPNAENTETIALQFERCRAWSLASGYDVTAEHKDEELSGGRADNRPGLQAALKDACEQKGVLVCYSLSRFARNAKEALQMVDALHKAGANLALLDLSLNTVSPLGRCCFTILAAVAELERQQIAQRTSDAMQRKQLNGQRMSKQPPYGFEIDPKDPARLRTSESEAAAALKILGMNAAGSSLREICRTLSDAGVKCRGKQWHHSTVKKIIERAKAEEF